MSRQTATVINVLALVIVAGLAAWSFIEAGSVDGIGAMDVLLASLFGVVVPAAVIGRWWSARAEGDQPAMLAIERLIPIVSIALLGVSMLGK